MRNEGPAVSPSPAAVGGTASQYFGAMVASYDAFIRRAVPHYEEMTARLLEYLPDRARRILELGCGTGNLSLALARRYPAADFTFVDAAPEMAALTSARLADAAPEPAARATLLVRRFEEVEPAPGEFDLVVSCISLHHVRDKAALYSMIRRALAAGGVLGFADQFRGATERSHEINWNRWLDYSRGPGGCTEAEVHGLIEHSVQHDHYVALETHFDLLRAAGFRRCDCVWRDGMWGIVTAEAA